MERGGTIGESEEHDKQFEQAAVGLKGCLPLVTFLYPNIVEPSSDVEFGEVLGAAEFGDEFWDKRQQVLVFYCHGIQCPVVLYQSESAILLFDKEDWRGHWGFGGSDASRIEVLLQEGI